jgi:hypothetical protein
MVYLDERFYNETGKELYRIKDHSKLDIIAEGNRNTWDKYTISDAFVCRQNGRLYVFGSGRNTAWMGYEIDEYNNEDVINLFEKYSYINF